MRCVLVNIQNEIVRERQFTEDAPPPTLAPEKGLMWLQLTENYPVCDDTQKVGSPLITIDREAGTLTKNYPAVPKPAPTRDELKRTRQLAVDAITVTVNGKTFDGDETSQTRMTRAITAMQAASVATTNWTLADNSTVAVTIAELTEALIQAGQRQSELWVI